jgi:hypothetical protein
MSSAAEEAVLLVRVWREPGVIGFRGRVIHLEDVAEASGNVVVVNSVEAVHTAVQNWLDAFLGQDVPG